MFAPLIGAIATASAPATGDPGQWIRFRDRFVTAEGRVIDTGNNNVSHSEGQGWAMLFAAFHDDRATFRTVYQWTRHSLQRPGDALFAWRYRPGATPPVDDPNNATDGDLYIAWALAVAGRRWDDRALTEAAAAIARDVLRLLTRRLGERLLLLPGVNGFENQQRFVFNPSYLVFPALAALEGVAGDARWKQLREDGVQFLRRARFGKWGLPPDWVAITRDGRRLSPAEGWPPRFSFDAVRVPLLMAWGGLGAEPAVAAAVRFWTDPAHRAPPAWTDLTTNALSGYPASGGVLAIASYAGAAAGIQTTAVAPVIEAADDYYSAALKMLVTVALTSQ